MNGAAAIARTLAQCGVELCLANPGTSEMHLVSALDSVPAVRCVLGLTESVVTGAADGYARIKGKPAATLLHCGPGLANGVANLHNARRAQVPLVNLVGDQATYHAPLDPPLAFETLNLARTVSGWARATRRGEDAPSDVAAAVRAAVDGAQIATVVLPSDVCWNEGATPAGLPAAAPRPRVSDDALDAAARSLRSPGAALLLGADALHGDALRWAGRIARHAGARLLAPSANARIARGPAWPRVERIPYAADAARALLAEVSALVLVGASAPVSFFAYPGKSAALLRDGTAVVPLARAQDDLTATLIGLAGLLGADDGTPPLATPSDVAGTPASTAVDAAALALALTELLPAGAIVVDESVSFGRELYPRTAGAAEHDWLQLTGGAIGDGIPLSTGAAIAAPGRRVVTLQADGSALYSVQGLWTQARLGLDVTTVVLSNRRYATLYAEMRHVAATPGASAAELFDLENPAVGWTALAAGLGVEAAVADSMGRFRDLFRASLGRRGPMLIELRIPG